MLWFVLLLRICWPTPIQQSISQLKISTIFFCNFTRDPFQHHSSLPSSRSLTVLESLSASSCSCFSSSLDFLDNSLSSALAPAPILKFRSSSLPQVKILFRTVAWPAVPGVSGVHWKTGTGGGIGVDWGQGVLDTAQGWCVVEEDSRDVYWQAVGQPLLGY